VCFDVKKSSPIDKRVSIERVLGASLLPSNYWANVSRYAAVADAQEMAGDTFKSMG
jgi:hypothetical protein